MNMTPIATAGTSGSAASGQPIDLPSETSCIDTSRASVLAPRSAAPRTSIGLRVRPPSRGAVRWMIQTANAAIGTLMPKTHRHEKCDTISQPAKGPSTAAPP